MMSVLGNNLRCFCVIRVAQLRIQHVGSIIIAFSLCVAVCLLMLQPWNSTAEDFYHNTKHSNPVTAGSYLSWFRVSPTTTKISPSHDMESQCFASWSVVRSLQWATVQVLCKQARMMLETSGHAGW